MNNLFNRYLFFIISFLIFSIIVAQNPVSVCSICNGSGTFKCTLCKGNGKWKIEKEGKKIKIECPQCNGTENQHCWACDGSGRSINVLEPKTNVNHAEGFMWTWCSSCHHLGINVCPRCQGKGLLYFDDGTSVKCNLCEGIKYTVCNSCKGDCGWYTKNIRCNVCEGSGKLTCNVCNGKGWFPPENIEKAHAEVCKACMGRRLIPHKKCDGKGCKECNNGKIICKLCEGNGAIIITPVPQYKQCSTCQHQGVLSCKVCSGIGYKRITEMGTIR